MLRPHGHRVPTWVTYALPVAVGALAVVVAIGVSGISRLTTPGAAPV